MSLLLSAGFLVFGGVGAFRYVDTFWLYRGFAPPVQAKYAIAGTGADRHKVAVEAGSVTRLNFTSAALGGSSSYALVYLPPGYAAHPSLRYPVLYLLHGDPGSPSQFVEVGDVAVTSDRLIAARRIEPMIIVMPSGSPGFFTDEEWVNSIRPHNDWETYLAHDVVTLVDRRYRTIDSAPERGLGGLSEGGYGALNIGFHHVGEFDLIEAWSPYYVADVSPRLFGSNKQLLRYNSPSDELPTVAAALREHHAFVWYYTGTYRGNHSSLNFEKELTSSRVASHYTVLPGHHNWKLWRSMMTPSLEAASNYFAHGPPAAPVSHAA